MSFVFYDTETTGTNTWFDQILQFAAIKTDADLNIIDTFEMRCRLGNHVVPAPGAMRVTQVRAVLLDHPALPCHYDMIRAIKAKFDEWSPATFIGHNSLEFDEDIFRQALYKTLHAPYLTQTAGNTRSDTLRMLHACYHFAPNQIAIPLNERGKPTFKLGLVAEANGFQDHNAHDALGDVKATIYLAGLVRDRAPGVWSAFMRFAAKRAVLDFADAEPVFCWSEIFFGISYPYLVTVIGRNPEISNEHYVFDLAVPPEELEALPQADLEKRCAKSPKPVRVLKANAVPILFAADEAPPACAARELGPDELERRAAYLADRPELRERLIAAYLSRKEDFEKSPLVERQIYDGFLDAEKARMEAFHAGSWQERAIIAQQFEDPRLKVIGLRLVHSEAPEHLDAATRLAHDQEIKGRIGVASDEHPWLTLPQALAELEPLIAAAEADQHIFLREHRSFLQARLKEILSRG